MLCVLRRQPRQRSVDFLVVLIEFHAEYLIPGLPLVELIVRRVVACHKKLLPLFAPNRGVFVLLEGLFWGKANWCRGARGRPRAATRGRLYGGTVRPIRHCEEGRRPDVAIRIPVQNKRIPAAPPGPRNDGSGGHMGPPLQKSREYNVEPTAGASPRPTALRHIGAARQGCRALHDCVFSPRLPSPGGTSNRGAEMGVQWKSSTSDFHWERTSSGRSESCPFGRDE